MSTQLTKTTSQEIANVNTLANETKETILIGLAKAKNTQLSYEIAKKQYLDFCTSQKLDTLQIGSVLLYLQSNIDKYKLYSLLNKATAINQAVFMPNELDLLTTKEFKAFRKGLQKLKTTAQKQAPAVQNKAELISHFCKIENKKHKAFLLIGLFGAFRNSELSSLKLENLTFESNRITIKTYKSKTNQVGNEELKSIPKHNNKCICPLRALKAYLKEEPKQANDFLFDYSRMHSNRIIKKYFGDTYSMHSLRATFVTLAKKAGATNTQIKSQTKHKSDLIIDRYYRNEQIHEENAVNFL